MGVTAQQWLDLYRRSITPHYLQSWEWYLPRVSVLATDSGSGKLIAGSRVQRVPVLGGKFAHYKIPRGPLFSSISGLRDHLMELREWLPQDALTLSVSPYVYVDEPLYGEIDQSLQQAGFEPSAPGEQSYYLSTSRIALFEDLSIITARYRSGFRRQLAKADKAGVRVEVRQDASALQNYIEGHAAANTARGALVPEDSLVKAWYELLASTPERMRLSFAIWQDCCIAGQISMRCGEVEVYEWGYSNPDPRFNGLPKSHLLHHHTLAYAQETGCQYYDLGGYWRSEGNRNSINRFKSMMSGEIVDLLPSYQYVSRPAFNNALKLARRIRTKYFD